MAVNLGKIGRGAKFFGKNLLSKAIQTGFDIGSVGTSVVARGVRKGVRATNSMPKTLDNTGFKVGLGLTGIGIGMAASTANTMKEAALDVALGSPDADVAFTGRDLDSRFIAGRAMGGVFGNALAATSPDIAGTLADESGSRAAGAMAGASAMGVAAGVGLAALGSRGKLGKKISSFMDFNSSARKGARINSARTAFNENFDPRYARKVKYGEAVRMTPSQRGGLTASQYVDDIGRAVDQNRMTARKAAGSAASSVGRRQKMQIAGAFVGTGVVGGGAGATGSALGQYITAQNAMAQSGQEFANESVFAQNARNSSAAISSVTRATGDIIFGMHNTRGGM